MTIWDDAKKAVEFEGDDDSDAYWATIHRRPASLAEAQREAEEIKRTLDAVAPVVSWLEERLDALQDASIDGIITVLKRVEALETTRKSESREQREARARELEKFKREVLGL